MTAESARQFSRPDLDRFRCVIQISALDLPMPGICIAQACFSSAQSIPTNATNSISCFWLHQASISIAVRDANGKLVMESVIETKAATIIPSIRGIRGDCPFTNLPEARQRPMGPRTHRPENERLPLAEACFGRKSPNFGNGHPRGQKRRETSCEKRPRVAE